MTFLGFYLPITEKLLENYSKSALILWLYFVFMEKNLKQHEIFDKLQYLFFASFKR